MTQKMSPLRRRMIEDMTIRGFTEKTQKQYIRHIRNFTLFPGQNPVNPLTARQFRRLCHMAAEIAEIGKRVTPHMLRHSFATHLLEQGVDIRVIQVLLGHKNIRTTTIYAQVATRVIQEVTSLLENLSPARKKDGSPG